MTKGVNHFQLKIYLILGPLCKPLLVMEPPNKRLLLLTPRIQFQNLSKVFWCKLYAIPNKRMFVASLKLLMLIYQCCFFLFFSQLLIAQQECCPLLTFGWFFVCFFSWSQGRSFDCWTNDGLWIIKRAEISVANLCKSLWL